MSRAVIDYYFWLNSDWALLGTDRLLALAKRHDVNIHYRPVDLPQIYGRTGGTLLGLRSQERQTYRITELGRWCTKLGITLNPKPAFMCPNADLASRVVIAADQHGADLHALHKAILMAQWCHEKDIASTQVLRDILASLGMPADELMAKAEMHAIGVRYAEFTELAIAAGAFGSPSYVFNGELFWGQDRLEMLNEAVESAKQAGLLEVPTSPAGQVSEA